MERFRDPIYKGCTAVATVLGVPLIPFIVGALVTGQLMVLTFYFFRFSVSIGIFFIAIFVYAWARKVGANDEHRLLQLMLKARMRGRHAATRRFWGAVSFSPLPPRK
uniref:VirB3 family type IV secretion system protein n=1 Tax=Acidovorax sp. SUPP3334 TaxID=2920881 RepID=UPI00295294B6|nr:VirB3 family type IV secretion system protein [Acidovorax sp. SUPP3334]BDH38364.1 VirB3 family type IV secretion system protein [Acidovorax sp. SUPP3334]